MREIIFYYRGAFYQYRGFKYFGFIIHDLGACFSIIFIAEMSRLSGIVLNNNGMPVGDQYTYCFGGQCNSIFLESGLLGNANQKLCTLWFYIKFFFKRLVTKRGADNRLLLRHKRVWISSNIIIYPLSGGVGFQDQ